MSGTFRFINGCLRMTLFPCFYFENSDNTDQLAQLFLPCVLSVTCCSIKSFFKLYLTRKWCLNNTQKTKTMTQKAHRNSYKVGFHFPEMKLWDQKRVPMDEGGPIQSTVDGFANCKSCRKVINDSISPIAAFALTLKTKITYYPLVLLIWPIWDQLGVVCMFHRN